MALTQEAIDLCDRASDIQQRIADVLWEARRLQSTEPLRRLVDRMEVMLDELEASQ
jgi:hypothetical protein